MQDRVVPLQASAVRFPFWGGGRAASCACRPAVNLLYLYSRDFGQHEEDHFNPTQN